MQTSPKKTADEEFDDVLDELNLDKDLVEKAQSVSVKGKKNISDALLKLQSISLEYKMTLEGRELNDDQDKYITTGKAIAGKSFIKLTHGLLRNFSDQSNLVSGKDIDKFNIQFIDCFKKVNNMMLRDRTIKEEHATMIVTIFKTALCNIGDVMTNTKGNMRSVMDNYEDEEKDGGVLN